MIKKGEELVCTNGHLIGIFKKGVEAGDTIKASYFVWKQKEYQDGQRLEPCQICGKAWYIDLAGGRASLLTRSKWLSLLTKKEQNNYLSYVEENKNINSEL